MGEVLTVEAFKFRCFMFHWCKGNETPNNLLPKFSCIWPKICIYYSNVLQRVLMTKYYFVKEITFQLCYALQKNYMLLLHNIKVKSAAWKISVFKRRAVWSFSIQCMFKSLAGYFTGYLRYLQTGTVQLSHTTLSRMQYVWLFLCCERF